jgi:diguanylate cyclase (GGDEF)-like protein/PAS domain S-box-containing protein
MDVVSNKYEIRHKWLMFSLFFMSVVVGAGWFATGYLGDMARQEIVKENEATITLLSTHLTDELKKLAGAAKAMSGSPWIPPALISGNDQDIARANSALDRYNSAMGASVSYLMDSAGTTIASSNRNDPDSFVGKSYQFRPYFTQAISGNAGRYFALGVTSLKRGFYASYPVRDDKGAIVGVVTMKKDLDDIEANLSGDSYFFFTNPQGIIFLSNKKEMLFKSLWPMSKETERALLASKQFGNKPFEAVLSQETADGTDITLNGKYYLVSRRVIDPEGWSIVLMNPTDRIFLYRSIGVIVTLLICTFILIPLIVNYKTARSAELVRESEERFRELFNTMNSGVVIYQAKGNGKDFIITDINPAGERISQVNKQEIIGKTVTDVFPGVKEIGLFDVFQDVWKTGAHKYHPVSLYKDNRMSQWVENNVYKLASGEIVVVYDDVTERKRMADEIQSLSITDQLTGLFNRRGFLALAEQQLKIADRTKKALLLLFIDLDGMKWINDNLGHKKGDDALVETANILKKVFRESDIIARVGGDEFSILALGASMEHENIMRNRLQNSIDVNNTRENRDYRISMSVGLACYDPETPCSIDDLMAQADKRMYEQKRSK